MKGLPATLAEIKNVYDGYSSSMDALESIHLALISIDNQIIEDRTLRELPHNHPSRNLPRDILYDPEADENKYQPIHD